MADPNYLTNWGVYFRYYFHRLRETYQGEKLLADKDVDHLRTVFECTAEGTPYGDCFDAVMRIVNASRQAVLDEATKKAMAISMNGMTQETKTGFFNKLVQDPHTFAVMTDTAYREKVTEVASITSQSIETARLNIAEHGESILRIAGETIGDVSGAIVQTAQGFLGTSPSSIGGPPGTISRGEAILTQNRVLDNVKYAYCNIVNATEEICKNVTVHNHGAKWAGWLPDFWYYARITALIGVAIGGFILYKNLTCNRQSNSTVTVKVEVDSGKATRRTPVRSSKDTKRAAKAPTKQILVSAEDESEDDESEEEQPEVETKTPQRATSKAASQSTPPQPKPSSLRQLSASQPKPSNRVSFSESKAATPVVDKAPASALIDPKFRDDIDELVGTSFVKAVENLMGWIAANMPPESKPITWSQSIRYSIPFARNDLLKTREAVRERVLVALLCADANELPPYHPCSGQFEPKLQKEWDKLGKFEKDLYADIVRWNKRDLEAATKVSFLLQVLQNRMHQLNPMRFLGFEDVPYYDKNSLLGFIYKHHKTYESLMPRILEILAARPLLLQKYLDHIIDKNTTEKQQDFVGDLQQKIEERDANIAAQRSISDSKWIYEPVWKHKPIDWTFVYYSLKDYSPTNSDKVTPHLLDHDVLLTRKQLYWLLLTNRAEMWMFHLIKRRWTEGIQSRHQVSLPFNSTCFVYKPGVVHRQLWTLMETGNFLTPTGNWRQDIVLGHVKVALLEAAARVDNEILEEHFLFTRGPYDQLFSHIVADSPDYPEEKRPASFTCRDFLGTRTLQWVTWLNSDDFKAESATIMADRFVKHAKSYASYFPKVHEKEVDQKGDICKVHVLTTIETSVSFVKIPLFRECQLVHVQLRQEFPGWNSYLDRFNYYQEIASGKYTMVVHQRRSIPALSKTVTTQMLSGAVLLRLLHTLQFVTQRNVLLHVSPDRIRYCPSSNVFFLELFYAKRLNDEQAPDWEQAFAAEKWAPLPPNLTVSQQQYAYLLLSWCVIKYPELRPHWGTPDFVTRVRTYMNKPATRSAETLFLEAALDGKDRSVDSLINGCVLDNLYDSIQELDKLHRWTQDLVDIHSNKQWAFCTPELLHHRLRRDLVMPMNDRGWVPVNIVKAAKGMVPANTSWSTAKDVEAFLKSIILLHQFKDTGEFDPAKLPHHNENALPVLLLSNKTRTAERCLKAVTDTLWFLENVTLLYNKCRQQGMTNNILLPKPQRVNLTRFKLGNTIEVDIDLKKLYIGQDEIDVASP